MNLLRTFRRPASTTRAEPDAPILGWMVDANRGAAYPIKTGSGWYGSGFGGGFGDGAFSETAFGTGVALTQSTYGWAAAYSVSTWVYRCIEVRKSAIHRMPWAIYSRATKQRIAEHPLELALKRNRQKLFKKIEQSQLLYGETFIEFAENDYHFRSDLFWLNNLGMAVLVGAGEVNGYSYTAMQGGHGRNFEPEQVAFMKTDNPFNDLRGMSPTEVIMDEIGIDKSVARVVRAYYANDTRVGLLFIPKSNLQAADAERFMAEWNKQNKGPNKAGKPNLMPFDMTVERVQEPATLDDVQLRESTRREIAAAYGVPLSLAGAWDDAKYQSLPEQRKSFYEETVIPECENIGDFINEDVMPSFDDSGSAEFRFDTSAILALTEDAKMKQEVYSARLADGGITRAEYRAALGHSVADVDKVYYIPAGSTVVPADEPALVTPTANQVEDTPAEQQAPPTTNGSKPQLTPSNGHKPPELPAREEPKALPAPVGKAAAQSTPLDELGAWERKALNHGAAKAAGFTCNVLPPEIQAVTRRMLLAAGKDANKQAIRAVFAAVKAALTPPAPVYSYWQRYDDLSGDIGSAWLSQYMQTALDYLSHLSAPPSDIDLSAALDMARPAFVSTMLGEGEQPGPLVKLVEAGMIAGHEALTHGSAANPQRPVSGKAIEVDWKILASEARDFAKSYLFDLIKNVDDTTRQAVREAVVKWVESGEPLDALKSRLVQIFQDEARAALISQTEASRAYAAGSLERYRRADVEKVKLASINDGLVCEICKPFEGTVVLMTDGWDTKTGNRFPPFHPGCRHWLKPVVED